MSKVSVCFCVLFFAIFAINIANSAKILGIFPVCGKSHQILATALMKGVAEKGHDVTFIGCSDEKYEPRNLKFRNIVLKQLLESMKDKKFSFLSSMLSNPVLFLMFSNLFVSDMIGALFIEPEVQELLKSNETFDAVIVEQFLNDAHKYFAFHFKAPLIAFSTMGANPWVNNLVGNPSPPSSVSNLFLNYSNRMTLCERIVNTLYTVLTELNQHLIFLPLQNRALQRQVPGAPSVQELMLNTSLVLLNAHESISEPVPLVPNMIQIGGYHIKPPKALPKDLQTFLDNAKEGVIYFSMGSNIQSKDMLPETRDILLSTFGELKEQVLWKWEDDGLPNQPKNVRTEKWLPQQDILAHPNIKLFITHGGLLSTTETVYHGVPILALPVFGDQNMNALAAQQAGFGLSIPFFEITKEKFSNALKRLLGNSSYTENAKLRSKLLHDRPMKPMDTALYWIEYIARTKGAPHLRVAALELSWYQYILLDVILVLVIITALAFVATKYLIKLSCNLWRSRKCNTAKQKTN